MATYKSSYTGPQIDQAVGNALNKDTSTLSNDVNHIPASSVVKSALASRPIANVIRVTKSFNSSNTLAITNFAATNNIDKTKILSISAIIKNANAAVDCYYYYPADELQLVATTVQGADNKTIDICVLMSE